MKETFTIDYKGEKIPVVAAEQINNIIFTLQMPRRQVSLEINDDGLWQEVEGRHTTEAQELGELIEKHDE